MPQLDIFSYPAQIFWASFFFISALLITIKFFLPDILAISKMRQYIVNRLSQTISKNTKIHQDINKEQSDFSIKALDALSLKNLNDSNLISNIDLHRDIRLRLIASLTRRQFWFTFLQPSDDFILVLAFFLFALVAYVSLSRYVSELLDSTRFSVGHTVEKLSVPEIKLELSNIDMLASVIVKTYSEQFKSAGLIVQPINLNKTNLEKENTMRIFSSLIK